MWSLLYYIVIVLLSCLYVCIYLSQSLNLSLSLIRIWNNNLRQNIGKTFLWCIFLVQKKMTSLFWKTFPINFNKTFHFLSLTTKYPVSILVFVYLGKGSTWRGKYGIIQSWYNRDMKKVLNYSLLQTPDTPDSSEKNRGFEFD